MWKLFAKSLRNSGQISAPISQGSASCHIITNLPDDKSTSLCGDFNQTTCRKCVIDSVSRRCYSLQSRASATNASAGVNPILQTKARSSWSHVPHGVSSRSLQTLACQLRSTSYDGDDNSGKDYGDHFPAGWTFGDAIKCSYLLVLGHNILHRKAYGLQGDQPSVCCPVLRVTNRHNLHAQPEETAVCRSLDTSQNHHGYKDDLHNLSQEVSTLHEGIRQISTDPSQESSQIEELDQEVVLNSSLPSSLLNSGSGEQDTEAATSFQSECELADASGGLSMKEAEHRFQLDLDSLEAVNMLREKHPSAILRLGDLASRGGSVATFHLALAYEHGHLVSQDIVKARHLYEAAARAGNPYAIYNLAVFHLQGRGGLRADAAKGCRLLRESAELGVPEAIHAVDMLDRDK